MPVVHAIAPTNFGPNAPAHFLPQGTAVSELILRQMFDPDWNIHYDPAFLAAVLPFLVNEEFGALADLLDDPAFDPLLLLLDSTTSVMASLAWDDRFAAVNQALPDWGVLFAPGARKYLSLSVGGHGTAENRAELMAMDFRRTHFFEQELKGVPNPQGDWAPFRVVATPTEPGHNNDLERVWSVLESDTWPLPGTTDLTFYLADGERLEAVPPAQSGAEVLLHQPLLPVSVMDYIQWLPTPEELMQVVPLDAVSFLSEPLPSGSRLRLRIENWPGTA